MLSDAGHTAVEVWVLRDNFAARSLYEAIGGVLVGEKVEDDLREVAYGWRETSGLVV